MDIQAALQAVVARRNLTAALVETNASGTDWKISKVRSWSIKKALGVNQRSS